MFIIGATGMDEETELRQNISRDWLRVIDAGLYD